ncbi:hypothetical protein [Phenylobacterium sp.]|uniref:hypothetical protein n=1 Tax=Phenylobacterium sp. TaxID=1871053 RepID=UPI002636DB93|nr:hypothetical protein [Phenylobacterium sp.]
MTDSATSPDVQAPDVELETTGVATADQDTGEGEASDTDHDDDGLDTEQSGDAGGEDDGLDDFELDGKTYRVPKALIEGQLRNEDYTRKTQELARKAEAAEARDRAAKAQEEFLATHTEAVKANLADVAELKALEKTLAEYQSYPDWDRLQQDNPAEFIKQQNLWAQMRGQRQELQEKVAKAEETLGLEARKRADEARESAIKDTFAILQRDIRGWNKETATKVFDFAEKTGGYSRAELLDVATDPRNVKLLHLAMTGQQAINRERAAKKAEQSQRTKPANEVGAGAPNARRASDPSGDALATKAWMERRNKEREAGK